MLRTEDIMTQGDPNKIEVIAYWEVSLSIVSFYAEGKDVLIKIITAR